MKAVFAGSFDPFTMGHLSIVCKASEIFEEVIVIVAKNESKTRHYNADDIVVIMNETFSIYDLNNVRAIKYDGLIARYCFINGIDYMVRGIRNSIDFQYEESISSVNKIIHPKIKTIYIPADDEYKWLSSSVVRDLIKTDFNLLYQKMIVPVPVRDYLLKKKEE